MKKLLILLAIILMGCDKGKELDRKIIISKIFTEVGIGGTEGVCDFYYKIHEKGKWIRFEDECDKYNVGDVVYRGKRYIRKVPSVTNYQIEYNRFDTISRKEYLKLDSVDTNTIYIINN